MGSNEEVMVTAEPSVQDGSFMVRGRALFSDVPGKIMVTPVRDSSVFVGATATSSSSRHVFTLGVLQYMSTVLLLFFFAVVSNFLIAGC